MLRCSTHLRHQPLIPQTGLTPRPRGQKRGAIRGTSCALQGCGCSGQVPRCKSLHRHEHACITNTSRHASSCWPRCKSLHKHKHACITNTSTHATKPPFLAAPLKAAVAHWKAVAIFVRYHSGTAPDVDAPVTGGLLVPRTNTPLPPRLDAIHLASGRAPSWCRCWCCP